MSESGFIRDLQEKKKNPNEIFQDVARVSGLVRSLPNEKLPPLEYINNIGCSDVIHYKNSSFNQFNEMARRFKVGKNWNILDMGCGCGRLAMSFAEYLDKSGRYIGFDVWPEGIEWCKENIRQDFIFEYLKAEDNYYYQDQREHKQNNFSMDFVESKSIDLVFAISVFTHLVMEDVKSYFNEINRVLVSGGYAYLTCFIVDKYFFEYQNRTGRFVEVSEEEDGCYYGYQRQDFFSGFTMKNFRSWLEGAGLELVFYELGTWAEKPGARGFQDLLIIRKI